MHIPLQHFEEYIDETILQRGLSYFKKGYVQPPEEITKGTYEAIVEGTDNYTVQLKLEKGNIIEYTCNCPYDFGPVCKHIAAVIFYLQQEELHLEPNSKPKTKSTKPSKRKTVAQQVDKLLEKLSDNELKNFIKEQANSDTAFRRKLLSTFAYTNENESRSFYIQQVKAILKTASKRHGYIDWNDARYIGKAVSELLETAQKHFDNANYRSAILICCTVLEEMTKALQFVDDSNGDIGMNIDIAYTLLLDIASGELPLELRKQLYDYTVTAFEQEIFSGWDWHLGMLKIASMIFSNENEAEKIITLLDQVKRKDFAYEFEQVQAIKLQIIKKTKGEKEADKFMEQNLNNPALRTEAIQKLISKKEYEKAISIAKDGVKYDAKDKPGLVAKWHDWLLKIAIIENDTENIINYARLLFVDSIREKQPYYDILKSHVDKDHWNFFVGELVTDIKKKGKWFDVGLIANIYINENSHQKLLMLLQQEFSKSTISMEYIKHYEKFLSKHYPEQIANLYEQGITNLMKNNTGRNHYQNACRYIRRMIKLGEKEKANELVEKLKATYPQRRALMEELENI